MQKKYYFFETLKNVSLSKKYIFYSIFFGLSSLVLPLGVQYLVNNLALAGIWVNTLSFLVIVALGLILSKVLRYCQIILNEYMQRELFIIEIRKWRKKTPADKFYYFLESVSTLKYFSKTFTSCVEIGLILFFGLFTIILFHPVFIVLALTIIFTLYFIFSYAPKAIETSIEESNSKYDFVHTLKESDEIGEDQIEKYLVSRDKHFVYIKKHTFYISLLFIVTQLLLIAIGIYLIQNNQMSVGQLVSAEIILSGILVSLLKLPNTLESFYDFETSQYKLNYALKDHDVSYEN